MEENQKLKWDFIEFEPKILNIAVRNKDFYFILRDNVKRSYFINEIYGAMFKLLVLLQKHINAIPSKEIYTYRLKKYFKDIKDLEKALEIVELMFDKTAVKPAEEEFIINEIDNWLKQNKLREAIMKSVDYIKINKFENVLEEIKDAVKFSSKIERGIDVMENVCKRYTKFIDETQIIPCPFPTANKYMEGGYHRGEINIVMAGSGYGKSAYLVNQAVESMKQNYNTVYVSLELNEEQIANRIDRCMWQMTHDEVKKEWKDVQDKWEGFKKGFEGKLFIKYANAYSFTSSDLQRYIDQLKLTDDFIPDVIIVDYLELMQTGHFKSQMKEYERQQLITAELRNMAKDLNTVLVTATQANRKVFEIDGDEGINEQQAIGESLGKIKIADTFVLIISTKEERAGDKARFRYIKNRHGVINNDIKLIVDYSKMKFVEEMI